MEIEGRQSDRKIERLVGGIEGRQRYRKIERMAAGGDRGEKEIQKWRETGGGTER